MSDKPTHISRARELRQNMTEAEKRLWDFLRNRKFHNLKFLRQHPLIYQTTNNQVNYFIPDFYCAERKIIIEVDGKIHDFQRKEDEYREKILKSQGMKILRIKNDETEDIFQVLKKIEMFIFSRG
jgi:very-short-patch-repair endonuclease